MWIFIGTIVVVLLGLGIYALVEELEFKLGSKKNSKYFENKGQKDIENLLSFMEANNIKVKCDNNGDSVAYFRNLLTDTLWHFQHILRKSLEQAKYKNYFELKKVGTIYYNSESALIYKDIFNLFIHPTVKKGYTCMFYDMNYKKRYWTLSDFFSFCKSLEDPNAYENLSEKIALKDLHWYVEYPADKEYQVAKIGASAILGGVLAGGVGALAGAIHSSNSQDKSKKDEIEVFWVQNSERYSIAKGEYEATKAMNELNKHLPSNRSSNSYKKHM